MRLTLRSTCSTLPLPADARSSTSSGDNPDNRSHHPAPLARECACFAGITINALAIVRMAARAEGGRGWWNL
jgi:hypothetical protein